MKFAADAILPELEGLDPGMELLVAFSGGLDSMVLLHALQVLKVRGLLYHPIRAIHVNHGLSARASDWQQFCEAACRDLEIPLHCYPVHVARSPGRSQEDLAREARYQVFTEQVKKDSCLLLAHQQDDQLETLLLRLTRGAGPGGLAGMPRSRQLGQGRLLRPLLKFTRESLHGYAVRQKLEWVEDESNREIDFDRNYWRREILPLIAGRWPGFRTSWLKSMTLCGEAAELAGELAKLDLAAAMDRDSRIVKIHSLQKLDEPRQRNVLRHWLQQAGFPVSGWQVLHRLTRDILAGSGGSAKLTFPAGLIQRYRDRLYLLQPPSEADRLTLCWSPSQQSRLNLGDNGSLLACSSDTAGEMLPACRLRPGVEPLLVSYRQGGEVCRLAGRPTKSLKKLQQEYHIPPWLRHRQPLLYIEGALVGIPGIGVSEEYRAAPGETGITVSWEPPDLLYDSRCARTP